ncbi:MAG TPA: ribosomal protein S18-alanine N-acetyltransferase [Jatrophihabitans sp.]|nr:ribosomal protein S18-alanine N-acetyltransferase [Jatrophihabitans sp.]
MRTSDLDALMPYENDMFGTESWSRQAYTDELAELHTRYYVVAEEDGAVLGSAGLMTIAETSQVMTVGVLPPARRRGVGELLLQELLAEARRRQAEEVLLEVRIDNLAARALYDKLGFAVIGTRRGYFDHGRVDALVMRLELRMER